MTVNRAFEPNFSLTPKIASDLMQIEASRAIIDDMPMSVTLLRSLRETAKLLTTHYSTQIEGNQLNADEVKHVIVDNARFVGRERDEKEVLNYYKALGYVETMVQNHRPISENDIQILSSLVNDGKQLRKPYREGQNVIRNSKNNAIVYMPPRASDVPELMAQLAGWINDFLESKSLPIPIIAGLAHYQFATIHPYCDGNGRTARLLATWILQGNGYGLKGIYSLEEYYAKNLAGYYLALDVGEHHNYYDGQKVADVTGFLEYFCDGMAISFKQVEQQAKLHSASGSCEYPIPIRNLLPEQREVIAEIGKQEVITSKDIAKILCVSERQAREYCARWTKTKFLIPIDASKRLRRYVINSPIAEQKNI